MTMLILLRKRFPEFTSKYHELDDRGLFWEKMKVEIKAMTITHAKRKAREKRDEEKCANYNETITYETERVKSKLAKIVSIKTCGTMVRSKAGWHEFGLKNSNYFFNLEKPNHRQKEIKTRKKEDGTSISNAKQILDEGAIFQTNL